MANSYSYYSPLAQNNKSSPKPKPPKPSPPVVVPPPRTYSENVSELLPDASLGGVIPKICGTIRTSFFNPLWWGWGGTYVVSSTVSTEEDGTVVTENQVKNYVNAHLGLCTGPDVRIRQMWFDNQVVVPTPKTDGAQFTVNVEDNFTGQFTFHAGGYNQPIDAQFDSDDNDLTSSYPGVSYLYMHEARIDGSFGGLSAELQRLPNPLGLAPSVAFSANGLDVNLMTLLIDALTDPFNGPGYSLADFDTLSLAQVAVQLAAENNFGSFAITDEGTTATGVIGEIENQADGVCYVDPSTGKVSFSLLRFNPEDYDPILTLRFGPDNFQSRPRYSKVAAIENVSKVQATYTSRSLLYSQDMVTAQAFLSPSSGRQADSYIVDYPYCCDKNLAVSLATRKLAQVALQQSFFEVEMDRSASNVMPGQLCVLDYPPYNIANMLAHVYRRKEVGRLSGKIIVTFRQVVQTRDIPIYPPAPEPPSPPDYTPVAIEEAEFMDPPFFFHMARLQQNLAGNSYAGSTFKQAEIIPDMPADITGAEGSDPKSWPMIFAKAANEWQYSVAVEAVPTFGTDADFWRITNFLQYSYKCTLQGAISRFDGFTTGYIDQITLESETPFKASDFTAAYPGANPLSDMNFVFIGDEIIRYDTITILSSGQARLNGCHRGMLDTVAANHADGRGVWLPTRLGGGETYVRQNALRDNAMLNDGYIPASFGVAPYVSAWPGIQLPFGPLTTEYTVQPLGTSKVYRLFPVTRSPKGFPAKFVVAPKEVTWDAPTTRRADRPNRPRDAKINGVRSASAVTLARLSTPTISWRIHPRWNTMIDTAPFFGSGPIDDRHKMVYRREYNWGQFSSTWGTLRPRIVPKQTDPSTDNEMGYDDKYAIHRVMLKDSANAEFILGSTLDTDVNVNSLEVTIPAEAAVGLGSIWVETELLGRVSLFKDLLPVNIS